MIRVELKEGEVYCPKCEGHKEILPPKILHYYIPSTKCKHCDGTGKLDWIENIVGKKRKSKPLMYSSSGIEPIYSAYKLRPIKDWNI